MPGLFSFFKRDPIAKLQKDYEQKYAEAIQAQRNGNIRLYSELIAASEQILSQIESLKKTE